MTDNAPPPGATAPGAHALPNRLSSGPAAVSRRIRRTPARAVTISLVGVLVIAAGTALLHATASSAYDDARAAFDLSSAQERSSAEALRSARQDADALVAVSSLVEATGDDALLVPEERAALHEASARLVEVPASVPRPAPSPSAAGSRPVLPWDLASEAARLRQDAETEQERARSMRDSVDALKAAIGTLRTAVSSAATAASERAAATEAQFVSARTGDVIALRKAATALATSAAAPDQTTAAAFASLESAVAGVRSSQEAELAEKAGPLMQTRLEIEAFARSIAGGVLLDFDWAPEVNGFGGAGGIGGLTSWNAGDGAGGFATVTLSDSVAEVWPAEGSRALVVHEVGHAISAKCYALFDWKDRAANESWATAWAIGKGETDDANGVWLYGYPSQSLIDTAATCR